MHRYSMAFINHFNAMLNPLKVIYSVLTLAKNVILRKKHHVLSFVAEVDGPIKRWYYDFKWWGFSHDNLEMVSGADYMCNLYANDGDKVTVDVISTNSYLSNDESKGYDLFESTGDENDFGYDFLDKILYGRAYQGTKVNDEGRLVIHRMWICPVTLFVLGKYPKYLYIKVHEYGRKRKA